MAPSNTASVGLWIILARVFLMQLLLGHVSSFVRSPVLIRSSIRTSRRSLQAVSPTEIEDGTVSPDQQGSNKVLQAKLSILEQVVLELKAQLEQSQQNATALLVQQDEQQARHGEEMERQTLRIEQLESQMEEDKNQRRQKVDELEKMLETERRSTKKAQHLMQRRDADIDRLEKDNEELQQTNAELMEQNNRSMERFEDLEQRKKALDQAVQVQKTLQADLEERIQIATASVEAADERERDVASKYGKQLQQSRLQCRVQSMAMKQLTKENEEYEEEIASLEEELQETMAELDQLKQEQTRKADADVEKKAQRAKPRAAKQASSASDRKMGRKMRSMFTTRRRR
mmetsp:Transcript_9271/g.25085  ORF Transcript_9271/g.25085 Transcript_9271/m.25085 type:complete len:345 (-) Transcript_9271:135-1169(-)